MCCPRVSTLNPYFNVHVFGALKLDALWNEPRPQAPDVSVLSDAGFARRIFTGHRGSTIYSNLLWDLSESFRIGLEVAYRETDDQDPTSLDNERLGVHTQFQRDF